MKDKLNYNEIRYITILPDNKEHLYESIDFTIGNVYILKTGKLEYTEELIEILNVNTNIKEIIFVDFILEYNLILSLTNKEYKVKYLFTKTIGILSNPMDLFVFEEIMKQYKLNVASAIGFCDEYIWNIYKENDCFYNIKLDLPKREKITNIDNVETIGVLNNPESMVESFYNALSAIKMINRKAKIKEENSLTKKFQKLFDIEIIENKKELDINSVNISINFDGNSILNFLNSMDKGIPCIVGNCKFLDEYKELKKDLVVKSDDSIDEIAKKIIDVTKNKDRIINEYEEFRINYINDAEKLAETFINN